MRRLWIMVAAIVSVLALAGLMVNWDLDRSPDTVASFDVDSATTTPPPPTLPAVPDTTTTTTTTTSTTAPTPAAPAPTALPAERTSPISPIAPPADPYGAEDLGQIGRIAIAKIGLDAPMLEGIRLTTLDRGPGHWPGTAMPGEVGNVVVAGHRTSNGAEFRYINELDPGDEVVFTTDSGQFTYRVTGTQIVWPDALWIIDQTETATATLFACYPLGSTAQRIVVSLELAS